MARFKSLLVIFLRLLVAGVALVYVAILLLVYTQQDALMFPVHERSRAELESFAASNGLVPFEVTTADGVRIFGLHRPAGGERAVIFHHGNLGGVMAAARLAPYLPGVDVFTFSYRGYPGSDPVSPNEPGLIADAKAVWDHVTGPVGIDPASVVLHGNSLGGGVVHGLLMEVTPAAVVLDSTFTSSLDVARDHYGWLPVDLLFRHRFLSADRAPKVERPVLLIHGAADRLIDVSHAERLHELLPDSRFVRVEDRGHEHWLLDEPEVRKAYQRFVFEQLGQNVAQDDGSDVR